MACFPKFQGSEKENKENRKTNPPHTPPTNLYTFTEQLFF